MIFIHNFFTYAILLFLLKHVTLEQIVKENLD